MGVPTSDFGYTSTTTGRGDHEVLKEHVVEMERKNIYDNIYFTLYAFRKSVLRIFHICHFISIMVSTLAIKRLKKITVKINDKK
jgi:hypothetical protein